MVKITKKTPKTNICKMQGSKKNLNLSESCKEMSCAKGLWDLIFIKMTNDEDTWKDARREMGMNC